MNGSNEAFGRVCLAKQLPFNQNYNWLSGVGQILLKNSIVRSDRATVQKVDLSECATSGDLA